MLDANEQAGTEQEGLGKLTTSCNLTNIHAMKHGTTTMATCARGTRKIDYMLLSSGLIPMVTRCGLLAFYDSIHSDHRGAFIDFNTSMIFRGKTPELHTHNTRRLTSKLPRAVLKYKTELWRQLEEHNISSRSTTIATRAKSGDKGEQFAEELNKIATTVQESMLAAEEKCTKMPKAPYSLKLANLNKIIRYWKMVKSGRTTG